MKKHLSLIICTTLLFIKCGVSSTPTLDTKPLVITPIVINEVDFWLTKADQTIKLEKQTVSLTFGSLINLNSNIEVDDSQIFQTVDGFGFTLTGGSAQVINSLNTTKKQELLQELFGKNNNSISISYLRLSIGASDLSANTFSYDDMPAGQTDVSLTNFSFASDTTTLIPILKEIIAINPTIKIIATPWSAPVWMKDNNNTVAGSLLPQYYPIYAQYFVKYIQKMRAEGIIIDAITPQNEPLNGSNNPSMLMSDTEQVTFIKNNLGPVFGLAGITTKIVAYDHNCDNPQYPISVLNDSIANTYIDGSAFHLYGGDISALSTVHSAFPNKNIYFTEQWTSSAGDFGGDLNWHLKNVIIGSMRNWSKNALEWNLANNASFGPHTPDGCTQCKGAITIENNNLYTQNVGYYIIGHISKFVPQGSVRIGSNLVGNLNNVAFKTPEGKIVLIVQNGENSLVTFNIKQNKKWVTTSLDKGSVGTYIWQITKLLSAKGR